MAKQELLNSLEQLRNTLAQYNVKVPELDRYIDLVSTRADDKHVDQYNELVSAYRNSQSKQAVINNGSALIDYYRANPDLKQLPNVERDIAKVVDSVNFTYKLGQLVEQYNTAVTIDDARAVLDRIEQLGNEYNITLDFITRAKAELDSYIDTKVVNQFNEYVDQFNTSMSADRRAPLAQEIQGFISTNPKIKETDSGKALDRATSEYLEFIRRVINSINTIESALNE